MKRYYLLSVLLLAFIVASLPAAREEDPSLLTLERIFTAREFSSDRFGPARWLDDGSGYTTLEPCEGDTEGTDIVSYDPESGQRDILVPAAHLVPEGETTPLEIEDYEWSDDGRKLLIFTDTARVWRSNTRGDYWVLDLESRNLHKLGGDAEPSTLMFAKFSPDGGRVAYVRGNNIYVERLEDSRIVQLTSDGSETIINGTSDWVYEEEFDLRDCFRWSPDGRFIAYWQFDSEGVRTFYLINNTDSLYPRLTAIPYPKAGEANSACRVGVVSAAGGETVWVDLDGDPRNHYIARLEWAVGSQEIVLQRLNRLQNANEVILGDAETGEARTILAERDEAWVDVVDDLQWLDGGGSFAWVSERDGWRHVYIASRSGGELRLITPGEFDAISIRRIDEEGGWLYYIASPDNPGQRFLFRVPLDGGGEAERITPTGAGGFHRYRISPNARWAFHTFSDFETPPVTELVRLPGHEVVRTLVDNAELRERVNQLARRPGEFFRLDIGGGVLLDAWCIKPPDFDPQRRYPVLFYVYGEPWGQTVQDRWGGTSYLWYLMLAQRGYLVMSVDNRGTPAPRGREWRKVVYRQIGILASEEQAAAVRAVIDLRDYVDPERIGIWGWSAGGTMSLNAVFRYPGLYRTAMAVAPVSDQRYYDTIYQERYMGLPGDNEEGYRDGSPITFAHRLEGNLLLVHGTGDDNVHYQNTEALVNELVAHNKRFTMMAYPNRSHSIYEGENTTRHLYELLTRYLSENLPPGPR